MRCKVLSAARYLRLVLAGELAELRQSTERTRTQLYESQQREKVLVRRLAAKEQETQDYVVSNCQKCASSNVPIPSVLRLSIFSLVMMNNYATTGLKVEIKKKHAEVNSVCLFRYSQF